MSQHDFDIANQSASSARADINNALKALASLSSGATAPSTKYANMLWYETDTNTLKMRTEDNASWIPIGYLNQSTDKFALFDNTQIVNSGGTQTGLLGDQAESVWEAGTGTTESLVSPAKVKAAIEALVPEQDDPIGVGQTWQSVTRNNGTSYQNTTGKPIQVLVRGTNNSGSSKIIALEVSTNNSSWTTISSSKVQTNASDVNISAIIPDTHYYKVTGSSAHTTSELR